MDFGLWTLTATASRSVVVYFPRALYRSYFRKMPIYEYECQKCKAHLEVIQKMSDKAPTKCRECGGRLEKLMSAPAIQFKGSGWYVTDYADNGRKAAAKADTESSTTSDKKPEKKSKETSPSKKTAEKSSTTKSKD